jgi:two-component system, OmpR family, response regulator
MQGHTADILLVEDDESLGFLIRDTLASSGWRVHQFSTGEKGLSAFHQQFFDLCILDVMLPQLDGYALAHQIRRFNQQIPIVFLTAKNKTDDRIKGFQAGADDYVCKPFSIEELKYRIDAVLKRVSGKATTPPDSHLTVSQTSLDVNNLTLTCNGTVTRLTYKETKVLQLLLRHAGKVIERDVFLKSIWEDDGFFVARSMDVFISRLRKLLKPDAGLRIENIRSVGYILKPVSRDTSHT